MTASMTALDIQKTLRQLADPEIAAHSQRFFKTGPGQYGEGDRFLGILVPILRRQISRFLQTPQEEILALLRSPYHEERLFALLLMVARYTQGTVEERNRLHEAYLAHTPHINNWDLVDSSAAQLVGAHLEEQDCGLLASLAGSDSIWERRIAIIATFHFIRKHRFNECLDIAVRLLNDREDLIHKATGWMLREVGKRDLATEETFLQKHYHRMPRTMLRYAIERFPENTRKAYLAGRI